ncbi:MFS transporter [Hansschlegelia quercus]|uniref:MFS transporter n=1 Tax=Hansschlegelia quercus TaxID=2528245 RepID=A0A4Q9GK26_9HYPH|nr:MFS transporter [Hansschlegelia quercus]TBN54633.1 MFS transporter [Hansschlegelia quercus]
MDGLTRQPGAMTEVRKRQIIVGVLAAMLLAALDQTIVAPAMATIGRSLGDAEHLPWVISAYLVTATAVTPLYGKLADLYGRRSVIFASVSLFVAASILCGLAQNLWMLIGARALQGLGGGGLIALAQTVMGDLVPPKQRGLYAAHISAVWATASVAGPLVGGVFAEHLHWSLVFWINLPLGFAALLVMWGPLKDLPFVPRRRRLDIPGAALVMAGASLAMLALSIGRMTGVWLSTPVLGLAAASVVATILFLLRLKTFEEPLIPLRVLRDPVVLRGTLAVACGMGGFVGLSAVVPVYLQATNGVSPDVAALGLIVMAGGTVVGSLITGRLIPRLERYRMPAIAGLAISTIALGAIVASEGARPLLATQILFFLYGLGLGPIFPTVTVSVQNAAGPKDLGAATGLLAFMRSLGSAFGVAILGAIVFGAGGEGAQHGTLSFDPATFRLAFTAALCSAAGAFLLVVAMPERPLRDAPEPLLSES